MAAKPKSRTTKKKAGANSIFKGRHRTRKRNKGGAQYPLKNSLHGKDAAMENDMITIPRTGETTPKPYQAVKIPVSNDPFEKNCFKRHQPPDGYIFVQKGNVYITRHCRSRTKDSRQIVYVVYHNSGKLTLGLYVPSSIYSAVLNSAAATTESRANAVKLRDEKYQSRARENLREQFPLMPIDSLATVLNHAFLKGSGRIGRNTTMSDGRKMLLAVEAHIRHTHTPYEDLLREGMKRDEARKAVWDTVRVIRSKWKGSENQEITAHPVCNPVCNPVHSPGKSPYFEVDDYGDTMSDMA